jgi:hypothetical protein
VVKRDPQLRHLRRRRTESSVSRESTTLESTNWQNGHFMRDPADLAVVREQY